MLCDKHSIKISIQILNDSYFLCFYYNCHPVILCYMLYLLLSVFREITCHSRYARASNLAASFSIPTTFFIGGDLIKYIQFLKGDLTKDR